MLLEFSPQAESYARKMQLEENGCQQCEIIKESEMTSQFCKGRYWAELIAVCRITMKGALTSVRCS